jgi:hypothetical protein
MHVEVKGSQSEAVLYLYNLTEDPNDLVYCRTDQVATSRSRSRPLLKVKVVYPQTPFFRNSTLLPFVHSVPSTVRLRSGVSLVTPPDT